MLKGIAIKISSGCRKERNSKANTKYMTISRIGKAKDRVRKESWLYDSKPMLKLSESWFKPYWLKASLVYFSSRASSASVTSVVVSVPSKPALTVTIARPSARRYWSGLETL